MNAFPVLFIGHGSPQNLIHDNPFTQALRGFRGKIPTPKAIVLISAHWTTIGTLFTDNPRPPQIFDFYGFQQKLYDVKYAPPGEPRLAQELADALSADHSATSGQWGIDHAATIPLVHLFPEAEIPVVEMSIDIGRAPEHHYRLGRDLDRFRDENVLFIGSGNLIHDFREIQPRWDSVPLPWAKEYNDYLKETLLSEEPEKLINYDRHPLSRKAFQTAEHYLPLLPILGLMRERDEIEMIHDGIQHGTISHLSFIVRPTD